MKLSAEEEEELAPQDFSTLTHQRLSVSVEHIFMPYPLFYVTGGYNCKGINNVGKARSILD